MGSSRNSTGKLQDRLADLRHARRRELRDPFGKVNCYGGYLLLALLALMVILYLDGDRENPRRIVALAFFLVLYWVFCLFTFAQLRPSGPDSTPGRHRRA
jgi:hypothetical protein